MTVVRRPSPFGELIESASTPVESSSNPTAIQRPTGEPVGAGTGQSRS